MVTVTLHTYSAPLSVSAKNGEQLAKAVLVLIKSGIAICNSRLVGDQNLIDEYNSYLMTLTRTSN